MTQKASIPLQSYQLAQYAVQAPCYICEGANTFDAEICRHCQAPMALAHQANSQKVHPRIVAAIGSSGAGKTVYLGMLMDMLCRSGGDLQVLARGAFSITLQQLTMAALSQCVFPYKTPNEPDRWNWVHCQVRAKGRKRPAELIMPDMAGEAFIEEIEHPNSYPVVRSLLSKCIGAMVLVDGVALEQGAKDQDFFTMKILSHLSELDSDPKTGWPNRPTALIFTKADECELCFEDPQAFARKHAPGLWQFCQEKFQRHAFFASGVAGSCGFRNELGVGRSRVPLRIEPRGIIEPFRWLLSEMQV